MKQEYELIAECLKVSVAIGPCARSLRCSLLGLQCFVVPFPRSMNSRGESSRMLKKWDTCFDELLEPQIINVFKLSPFAPRLSKVTEGFLAAC
jgi:hypothetical protein